MRIALICGPFPPEHDLLDELAARGVELTVYGTEWAPPDQWWRPEAPRGAFAVRASTPILRTRRGQVWYVYPGMRRYLKRDRPDLIHVISEPWGALAVSAAAAKKSSGARLVVHGCDRIWEHGGRLERWMRNRAARFTLSRSDAYLAESSLAIEIAQRNRLPGTAITAVCHTNPRNASMFRPVASADERCAIRASFGLPTEGVGVLFLGAFSHRKGMPEALQAIVSRGALGAGWIAVAGRGPLEEQVRAAVRSFGDQGFFLGRVPYPQQVAELLRAVDVLLLPSRTTPDSEEQGPRVVLEAMLSGVAVVASSCGALPEMIGEAGIVFPEDELEEMVRSISRLMTQERERLAYAGLGLERATQRFSTKATATILVRIWEETLGSEGLSPSVA